MSLSCHVYVCISVIYFVALYVNVEHMLFNTPICVTPRRHGYHRPKSDDTVTRKSKNNPAECRFAISSQNAYFSCHRCHGIIPIMP